MEYAKVDPGVLELVHEAEALRARRNARTASEDDVGRERALRLRLEAMLDARGCECACGEAWRDCACRYCSRRIANRDALWELEPRDTRDDVTLVMGDVEALAGVLSRLAREGEHGQSFAVAAVRGTEVYVQFAGSPREPTMLWEATGCSVKPNERGVELLRELGFHAPGEEGTSPNYHQEIALGEDRDATLLHMTLASFRILREGYGCPADAIIDVDVHMGAWGD